LTNQIRRESVEAGIYSGMRRKHISRPRDREGFCKREPGILHVATCPFQYGERRMPFVQVAHFRLDTKFAQATPTHHAENQLLFQPELRAAAIEFAGDTTMLR
jgi:hypothetical protein